MNLKKPLSENEKILLGVSAQNTAESMDITEVREISVKHKAMSKKMEQSEEEIQRFLKKERAKYKVDTSDGKFKQFLSIYAF